MTDFMELIDTHCHLDVEEFSADRIDVLKRARAAGVKGFIVPGVMARDWGAIADLARKELDVFPAYGLHPLFVANHADDDIARLEEWLDQHPAVAIGEIGLDYYPEKIDRDRQRHFFAVQLQIARDRNLPVILHVRKAHDDVLQLLRRIRVLGGTAHAFNGSLSQAEQYLSLGFKLGFGGMLTYERSAKLRRLAMTLPLEGMVLETDAPDMTVASHHGERNSPEYLPECHRALAELRGTAPELVASVTTATARQLFRLPSGR